ncbi:MAG TPA: MBL fold metallo-hydrolase [Nitrososphaeraceae archaeon]|nr:MBL fold metallo-hydrolase [Nitrososphaeraceae archaeon]
MSLQEIDKVTIMVLMDNSTDLLLTNSEHAIRIPLILKERINLPPPIAEHGFSALVNVVKYDSNKNTHGNNHSFLFDTGVSENGVIYNANIFGIDFDHIKGIILSHGHFDHFTGLVNIINTIHSRKPDFIISLYTHPDAFLKRWLILPNKNRAKMPVLDKKQLQEMDVRIHMNTGVRLLPSDELPYLLMTGEIPREKHFEKGFPIQYVENSSNNELDLLPDPLVKDDQALVVNVKNKGLMILTACGHSGIINTINYAKKVTGISKIHAVIGGFHLPTGGIYDQAIEPTMKELEKINPDYIVPCHCTGWKATNRIAETFPEKFIQAGVGTTFNF